MNRVPLLTVFSWLARLIVWPVVLLVVLYLILLAINAQDKPATPEALRFDALLQGRAPVADADNGYVYLLGVGQIRENDPRYKKRDDAALRALREQCAYYKSTCTRYLETHPKELHALLLAEAWTFARYRDLIAHRSWRVQRPLDLSNYPRLISAADGQNMLMLEAWQRAQAGNAAGVRELLAAEHSYWRMVLGSTDDLLSKMYATAALKRHLVSGSVVIAGLPRDLQAAAIPEQWRMPLSPMERSLRLVFAGEYEFLKNGAANHFTGTVLDDGTPAWCTRTFEVPFLQLQDTLNSWSASKWSLLEAVEVDYREMPASLKRLEAQAGAQESDWYVTDVYNPVGKASNRSSQTTWPGYAARITDLEGIRRVALLATELRSAGVAPSQLGAMLASAVLRNPYDKKPFEWNKDSQSIMFTGLETGERGIVSIAY